REVVVIEPEIDFAGGGVGVELDGDGGGDGFNGEPLVFDRDGRCVDSSLVERTGASEGSEETDPDKKNHDTPEHRLHFPNAFLETGVFADLKIVGHGKRKLQGD